MNSLISLSTSSTTKRGGKICFCSRIFSPSSDLIELLRQRIEAHHVIIAILLAEEPVGIRHE